MQPPSSDLTVFGATGYSGQLALEYLDALFAAGRAPKGLRVAAGGRNRAAVEAVVKRVCRHFAPAVVVADVADEKSVYLMVAATRVVMSCVGPYAQFGEPVVKACASLGVDYVDITGEQRWIEAMRTKYDDVAHRSGARLIPFSGQDSVPSDLTAWFTLAQVPPEELAQSHAALMVCANIFGRGVSNGTFKTSLDLITEADKSKLEPEGPFTGQRRLSDAVQLVDDVPAAHGGPLAVVPSELLPDAYVTRLTHSLGLENKAGRLETTNALVLPNRLAAYGLKGFLLAAPYFVRVLKPLLTRLSSSGQGPSQSGGPGSSQIFYGVLRLYPLKGSLEEQPLERIVTRIDVDRDPYLVTAVTSCQVALALLDKPEGKGGFFSPVAGIGGQELLQRCYECFRVQLVSRM